LGIPPLSQVKMASTTMSSPPSDDIDDYSSLKKHGERNYNRFGSIARCGVDPTAPA
jgi:hypothetical protein